MECRALDTFPQFTVGSGPTTTGFFASGQATLNMRGLGSVRNLVLLDGRRIQPSNSQQVVDINTIPKALIESVEIITGGASAVYGSDAVAGVVNFKTRRNFKSSASSARCMMGSTYCGSAAIVFPKYWVSSSPTFLSIHACPASDKPRISTMEP